jgi:hypothetical protein
MGAKNGPLVDRFWAKVIYKGPNDCWLFTGAPSKRYGEIFVGDSFPGRRHQAANRVSYLLNVGPIPDRLHVLHSCDNDRCVNPAHLRLGTHQDNMRDRKERKRSWSAPGALNPAARLTSKAVAEIREASAKGEFQRQIAKRYGVAQSTIGRIIRKENWRPTCSCECSAEPQPGQSLHDRVHAKALAAGFSDQSTCDDCPQSTAHNRQRHGLNLINR